VKGGMLQAGKAEVEFTPEPGLPLADAAPIAKGAQTPLFAKAVVLSNGRDAVAIVTLDLIGFRRGDVKRAAQEVSEACGIPEENLLVVCSHTHTAPKSVLYMGPRDHWLFSFPDEVLKFADKVVDSIVDAVAKAKEDMGPASVGVVKADLPWLSFNRRRRTRNYGSWTYWCGIPKDQAFGVEGPIDPELGLFVVRGADHRPIAFMWNFAGHNSFHFGDQYHADLAYSVQAALDERLGKHIPCLYLAGCGANLNYHDYEMSELRWDGKRHFGLDKATDYLTSAIIAIYREVCTGSSVELGGRKVELSFAQRDYQQNWYEDDIAKKLPSWVKLTNQDLEYMQKEGKPTYESDIMALRVGDTALVGLPGEVFVEFQLAIKRLSPFPKTYVCAYANDYCGYVSTRRAFIGGCYEAWPNCYMRVGKEGGYLMVDKAVELLYDMYQEMM